jgi:methylated-DNA-protein-cysteine methyltransferase-like protein
VTRVASVRSTDPLPPNAVPWAEGHEPTEFQRAVIEVVRSLHRGELATYGEIAEEVGRPGAGQAVANVLRRTIGLPWWRVVPADGRLYRSHEPVQAPLLASEGHHIDETRRIRGT